MGDTNRRLRAFQYFEDSMTDKDIRAFGGFLVEWKLINSQYYAVLYYFPTAQIFLRANRHPLFR